MLEGALIGYMTMDKKDRLNESQMTNLDPLDEVTFKLFVKEFNEKYSDKLFEEQLRLIYNHVLSFEDNGIGLKLFVNEELKRVKKSLKESLNNDIIKDDKDNYNLLKEVLEMLESYKNSSLDDDKIVNVLYAQQLVREFAN